MTKRQFVVLVFRLFALYLAFNLITSLGTIYQAVSKMPGALSFSAGAFTICIMLFAIALLWRKSEWLMFKVFAIPSLYDDVRLVKDEPFIEGQVEGVSEKLPDVIEIQDYYETPISKESIEIVAFSAIGLWMALSSLPWFFRELWLINPFFPVWTNIGFFVPYTLQFVAGIWLFLRPWQFQGWIEKFKPQHDNDKSVVKNN